MRRVGLSLLALGVLGGLARPAAAQPTAPTAPTSATPPAPPATAPPPAADTKPAASAASSVKPMPESGYHVDVGVAFSLPTGSLNGLLLGAMPLVVNVGRRFSRQLILGVSGTAAVTFPIIGAGYGFTIGGGGEYYLGSKLLGLDPWLGANFGFEIGAVTFDGNSTSQSGWLGTVAAGVDYRAGFAPFASFSLGSFGSGDMHEYITLGMRGVYDW